MRTTQRAALDLFEAQGFESVTVAEIAETVGMAASTIYRHFETKEAIVLWDEHDDNAFDAAFVRALSDLPPLRALRAVFVEELGDRYEKDLDFQLRRVRYICETEAVHTAAAEADYRDTQAISAELEFVLSPAQRHAAPILAGAAMRALDVAFDRWQRADGSASLGDLIGEAFDVLAGLDDLT